MPPTPIPRITPSTPLPQTYRHLLRAALLATQNSQPASTVVRKHLRRAFRGPPDPLAPLHEYLPSQRPLSKDAEHTSPASRAPADPSSLSRTLLFLHAAARSPRGLEGKVFKNIVRVWGERSMRVGKDGGGGGSGRKAAVSFEGRAWDGFERGLGELEGAMGVVLR